MPERNLKKKIFKLRLTLSRKVIYYSILLR
nr:MAG TPA: hypothetical protein [Crassvirales sp.]DAK71205.1 MAG TPA: hypothetical protein [Caudoviricetes sp.]DAP79192.1 MAG TPA: hypothetical protein [Caudoviricetes sp.]